MKTLKKTIAILLLSMVMIFSSPATIILAEAQPAKEAQPAQEAEQSPTPAPTSSPPSSSPSPSPNAAKEASSAPEASPVVEPSPSPKPSQSPQPTSSLTKEEKEALEEQERQERIDEYNEWLAAKEEWENTHNDSGGNVGDTSVKTGSATSNGVVSSSTNQNNISGPNCSVCSQGSTSVTNSGNGSGSNNSGAVSTNNTSSVQINNDADIENNLDVGANTGFNGSSKNVGDSSIETGDANVSGVVINSANNTNLGVVEYNIDEDHNGDIILQIPDNLFGCSTCGGVGNLSVVNEENGSDSQNSAVIENNNESNTEIYNNGDLVNNLDLKANTGYNDASKNTAGNSSITTGDANVSANIINMLNSTIGGGAAFVVNIFGNLVGDIIFPDSLPGIGGTTLNAANTGNGSGSTNNSSIQNNNQTNVNFDNDAYIENNLLINANTGGNSTNKNTGGDNSIETGDVYVNAEVINVANTNYFRDSDEPLWLLLVNNMGTWTGQIVGAITGQNYSGSSGLVFTVGDDGQITASNSGNGADSNNNASTVNNNQTNLNIANNANLVNNVNISANTGYNEADKNTGGNSTIKTGDVNVAASIINFVNTNLIGRTVMLGIVNVFGSWTGDAVPPGYQKQVKSQDSSNSLSQGSSTSNSSSGGSSSTKSSSQQTSAAISQLLSSDGSSQSSGIFLSPGSSSGGSGALILGENKDSNTSSKDGNELIAGKTDNGFLSFTFNLKLLLLGLLPLVIYSVIRIRNQRTSSAPSYAHKISVKK